MASVSQSRFSKRKWGEMAELGVTVERGPLAPLAQL